MASKQALERQISSTEDMSSIVSTMKSLAAVNVRLFESARRSMESLVEVLERGFQVALGHHHGTGGAGGGAAADAVVATGGNKALYLVFGSVQGMCGQFNDHLATFVDGKVKERMDMPVFLVTGERITGSFDAMGYSAQETLPAESSFDGVTELVYDCIDRIQAARTGGVVQQVYLFYNEPATKSSYRPTFRRILPLDAVWLGLLRSKSWPGRSIPMPLTTPPRLIEALVENYLFGVVYQAALESLAGENAARLSSMQAAEQNIQDRLEELHREHNRRRQAEITEELLDIVGGYTALGG